MLLCRFSVVSQPFFTLLAFDHKPANNFGRGISIDCDLKTREMHGILEVHLLKFSRGNMPSSPLEARVLSARRKAAMLLLKPPFFS